MLRSKSVEDLPSFADGDDMGWSEEDTRQAMLDIIQSDGDLSLLGSLNPQRSACEWRGTVRDRAGAMWSFTEDKKAGATSRRTAKSTMDRKSIYDFDRLATPGRELPPSRPQRPRTKYTSEVDVDTKREREYIIRCNLPRYSRGPFNKMILQTFYKAPKSKPIGYGMPRPFTREASVQPNAISSINSKTQSYITINRHRSLCQPHPCSNHDVHDQQYCDILGPGTCSRCIESTNRHIAEVIQKKMFPTIEVSNNCLVVPKLSRSLKEGHMKQIRKRPLQEFNLPDFGRGPSRQMQSINWETLHHKSPSSKISTCGSVPSVSCTTAIGSFKSGYTGE
ncbi:uncharacterized protein LOC124110288 [Haliotis rufescens]|uniref:uncharacterized protein LOC124110288 n=1 Tax=Haliotis rufescens TaxID=6454 RepID=UPI00201EFD21|nr:uncharacterized protein LOC124110288 [Haliotis rufescens]